MGETMTQSAAGAFSAIYSKHSWKTEGAESLSGPGSDPVRTRAYRRLLEKLLRRHRVRSVVDLGCGDWASSRLVDWSGIDYLGLDVVPVAIEHCQTHYSRSGVRFEVCDLIQEEPPPADLLICKEVLQHLPSAGVHRASPSSAATASRSWSTTSVRRTANPAGSKASHGHRAELGDRDGELSTAAPDRRAVQPERPAGAQVLEP